MPNGRGAPARAPIPRFPIPRWSGCARSSGVTRWTRRRSPRDGWVCGVLTPQVSQRSGWPVVRALNAKMGGNAFPQIRIDGDDARLAVQGQKAMALGKRFKFFFDFRLIQDEGLK